MEKNTRYWILAALSLIGFVLSAILSRLYYVLRSGTGGFKSFCNLGDSVNCDAVTASPYAELFGGIPLSSFSAGWFLATIIIAMLAMSPKWRREANRALFLGTGIATVFSLVYLAIMTVALKTFCLLCLGIDAIAILSFIVALTLKPESLKTVKPDWGQWRTVIIVVGASLFLSVVVLKGATDPVKGKTPYISETVRNFFSEPILPVEIEENAMTLGPEDAPITIVKFSDFQCPFCKTGAQTFHMLMNRYPGKIRIVLKNFPLDPSCNPHVSSNMHPAACEASRAAICADQQGEFQAVYESIFENQEKLAPGVPTDLGKGIVKDDAAFDACMNSEETRQRVAESIQQGVNLGVRSTPTVFVNGRMMQGVVAASIWDIIIPRLLENP